MSMKKILSVIISLIFAFGAFAVCAGAASLPEKAVIVIPAGAKETEKYAADTLAEYIGKLTGKEIKIKDDLSAPEAFEILVGNTSRTQSKTEGLADGSYFIKSGKNNIEIAGAGNRGNIYGVYRFLHEFGGYNVFTAETGMQTDKTSLEIPDDADISYTPCFEYTDTDWHSPKNDIYSLANGLNGSPYRTLSAEQGGNVSYISNFCHTLTTEFCSAEKYFDEHPEYFALRDGKRMLDQLCLTNDEVYKVVLGEVLDLLKEKHDPEAAVQIVSLTQNDNRNYCQCDKCRALDEENGSQSGTMITFVNRIADAVKAEGYENTAIDTFAYQYTRKAPKNVKPADNVIVRLCTIECCFSHPLSDPSCDRNKELKSDLENWYEICKRIYVWDYTTNYAYTVGIFPDFGVLQANMQFFRDHGVKGVYEEGAYYVDECNTEFGELRAYLISKLLQDPDCDFGAEMLAFCKAYYGEGGEKIKEFIDATIENAAGRHVEIYSKMSESLKFSDYEAQNLDKLWEEAKKLTKDEAQLKNIERSELSWRYVKASLGLCEFKGMLGGREARIGLYNDLIASGIKKFSEGNGDTQVVGSFSFLPAENWQNNDGFVSPLYIVSIVIYALAIAAAAVLFALGIKQKKYRFCVHLPLFAAFIEVLLWSRRAFLAWKDLDQYAVTLVLFFLIIGFAVVAKNQIRTGSKSKTLIFSIIEGVIFYALYELPILIINVWMYDGRANDLSLSVSYVLCFVFILAVFIHTIRILKKSDKEQ